MENNWRRTQWNEHDAKKKWTPVIIFYIMCIMEKEFVNHILAHCKIASKVWCFLTLNDGAWIFLKVFINLGLFWFSSILKAVCHFISSVVTWVIFTKRIKSILKLSVYSNRTQTWFWKLECWYWHQFSEYCFSLGYHLHVILLHLVLILARVYTFFFEACIYIL